MSAFLIGLLAVLIIAQNIFWARMHLSLVNRLMSRNYSDFELTRRKPVKEKLQSDLLELTIDPEDERKAAELNSLMGIT